MRLQLAQRTNGHGRPDLHADLGLVSGQFLDFGSVTVVVSLLAGVVGIAQVDPRSVDAEANHSCDGLLVQVVAASGSERCAETGFELLALAEIQFLRNEAQVDILGPPCLGFLSRSGDARQQPGCRD